MADYTITDWSLRTEVPVLVGRGFFRGTIAWLALALHNASGCDDIISRRLLETIKRM
jgi:hypothetical protein